MTPSSIDSMASPKKRVPFWDNARWIAITLVVMGHAILKLIQESDAAYDVYLFIYAFHVPLFVAVSGFFAKSLPPGLPQMKRLLTDIALPYLIFETIWTLVRWLEGGRFRLDYSTASWTLWFLLALIFWRVLLPYLVLLRYPLLISIVISIGAGYFEAIGTSFVLGRTLGLLPFFVFGWKLNQWRLTDKWLPLRPAVIWRWRAGALAVFAALMTFIILNIGMLRTVQVRRFLTYDTAYPAFGYDEIWAGGIRLGVMLVAFALIIAFLMLIPRRLTWFTSFGTATMYVYLLHTFLLYPLRESGWLDGPQPGWMLPALIVLSVLISAVLSLPLTRRLTRPVIEPKAPWLFRPEPAPAPAPAPVDPAR
jgi:fucose 4-O-acetylase-like acetyltransferase